MKTRLLCLLLCLVTMLSLVLTGCSSKNSDEAKDDVANKASQSAITLSMWVVSEEPVSDRDAAAVSFALNQITKAKFKTQLVLNFYTKDEYRSKLEDAIVAFEESRKNQGSVEEETEAESGADNANEVVTDEMITDDRGLSVIKYPELLKNQVDIIYIGGEDMYLDFVNKGWLAELDDELATSAKKIQEYVSGTLLSAVKTGGATYAIPNNRVIGEYTYMMLNKDLVEKYQQKGYVENNLIDGLFNDYLYTFLNMVNEFGGGNEVPIDATYEECLEMLAHYWSVDPETYDRLDKFSVFGSHYKNIEELSRGSVILGYTSLFEDEEFTDAYLQLNKFKFGTEKGSYFGTSSADKPAAVTFVTGKSSILSYNEAIDDYEYVDENGVAYYPIVVKYPTAKTSDIYDNMFGVYSLTRNVSRSMDIVTYLNTNADFRNILQYGVDRATIDKNAINPVFHYEVAEDEKGNKYAHRLNENYMMELDATGNMFIAYPAEMSSDIWESGKVQNRNSLVDPMLGLDFASYSAALGAVEEEIVVPVNPGYLLSYSGGYSKSAFSENAAIKAWLDACDAGQKGIYVLPTEKIVDQTRIIRYYVYNTDVSKAVDFKVDVLREMSEVTNDKGQTEKVQSNLDFTFTYTNIRNGGNASYNLAVVDLATRVSNEFELLAKVNDTEAAMTVGDGISLVKVDPYKTSKYTIEVYDNASRNLFAGNRTISRWINSCASKSGIRVPTSFTLVHEEEKNDKIVYTVILYRDRLKELAETTVVPTGDGNKLDIQFNVSSTGDDPTVKYTLSYVQVVADKDMELSYSIICDSAVNVVDEGNVKTKEDDDSFDPNFRIWGNLDTELVKYLDQLSEDAVVALNSCTTYEELLVTVDYLKDMLCTGERIDLSKWDQIVVDPEDSTKFVPMIKWDDAMWAANNATPIRQLYLKYVKKDLSLLSENLQAAVATETKPETDPETNEPVKPNGEDAVYFDSPNTIYYMWLKEHKYMPENK